MFFLSVFSPLIFMITFIVLTLALVLAIKTKNDREKGSPFECGFDSNSSTRLPFSLRFFLITIIFLIFDVEIVMLLPCIKSLTISLGTPWIMVYMFFMLILLLGLFHEWNQGALNWSL